VSFLDVGQGDAIFVQTPTGRRVLIDGGPSPALLLEALAQRLPFWDRHIDLLLLSHPHEDHLLGLLPVAQRYRVGQVLVSAVPCDSPACEQWKQILREQGVPLLTVRQPLQIDLGDGPVLQVYPPAYVDPDASDPPSLVARLSWGSTACLFSGDMDAQGLRDLWQVGLPVSCTVLKVPHHGSADGLDKDLLAALHPNLAVISVGAGNLFGHPAPGTLQLLAAQGILIYRTDQNGDVDLTVDATSWKASSERVAASRNNLLEGSRDKGQ
jgi:competence protein ComEC